jgi:hypothetical protein
MKIIVEYLNEQALVADLTSRGSPEPEIAKTFASIAEHFRERAQSLEKSAAPGLSKTFVRKVVDGLSRSLR